MAKITLFQPQRVKIGKEPAVILSMKKWKEIEDILEDYEMCTSVKFRKDIIKARREIKKGKLLTLEEVEKRLGIA
jgi:predicted metal-binding protein